MTIRHDNAKRFIGEHELACLTPAAIAANNMLAKGTGAGNDFLGWVNLPTQAKKDAAAVKKVAHEIRDNAEVLVVAGIGGSYLGARAVVESFADSFALAGAKKGSPAIVYAGNNLSGRYHNELMRYLDGKEFYVNVISKSGTTTEPAIAFRLLKEYTEKRYGEKASERIIATTDRAKGALRTLATEKKYRTFVIPDDVGGRYSVLTPVGLIPIAAAGIDIDGIIDGAIAQEKETASDSIEKNTALRYAVLRNALYAKGFATEIMVNYIPRLHFIAEWWKQLYGESEGKDQKGIFPAAVDFTTDLHSLGQYIQDGRRTLFETVLRVKSDGSDITMQKAGDDADGLNYLAGKGMHEINDTALMATVLAHTDGGVPNLALELDAVSPYTIGELLYCFEKACGISGYMLGVNPFDQPGVEAYKKNMFALLGKKGYEKEREALMARVTR
ncbi:MAG: glucose-6-phosphate isomerase [Spirochaetes bacterium]|nr:glucose-6-phosphate isomerase [Spirochaetota bacterium]